jgi:molybdopterin-guanine dinucleotide biosynthesis protein A
VPGVPETLIEHMKASMQDNIDITVASIGARIQPVIIFCRTSMVRKLEDALEKGNRKVADWVLQQQYVAVDFTDNAQAFENINTRDELTRCHPV